MKKMLKPTLIAIIYMIVAAGLFAFDIYYLRPSMYQYVNSNFALSQTYDNLSSLICLFVIPLIVSLGTIHTLFALPISGQNKKIILKISTIVGFIFVPIWISICALNSKDGPLIWLGLVMFMAAANSLTIIFSVAFLFIKNAFNWVRNS